METRVQDTGLPLTRDEYPYLEIKHEQECLDIVNKLDATGQKSPFKSSGKIGECVHDYCVTEFKQRSQPKKIKKYLTGFNSVHAERLTLCTTEFQLLVQKEWICGVRNTSNAKRVEELIGDFFELLPTMFIC